MCLFQYDDDPEPEERIPAGMTVDPALTAPAPTPALAAPPVAAAPRAAARTARTARRESSS